MYQYYSYVIAFFTNTYMCGNHLSHAMPFVLFFISDIAASILFGILFESVIGLFCGLLVISRSLFSL